MRYVVKMKWVEAKNMWNMENLDGEMIQELYHCSNICKFFDGLDKGKDKLYVISVKPMEGCNDA